MYRGFETVKTSERMLLIQNICVRLEFLLFYRLEAIRTKFVGQPEERATVLYDCAIIYPGSWLGKIIRVTQ